MIKSVMNKQMKRSGDFHCHLDDHRLQPMINQILNEYFSMNYQFLVAVMDAYQPETLQWHKNIAANEPRLFLTAGAHPHNAGDFKPEQLKAIKDFHQQSGLLAIGECGLDFYYNLASRQDQISCFAQQVKLAKELQLPLIIHSRQAEEEIIQILTAENFQLPFIMHCYSGSAEMAERLLQLNCWLSFSGIITFKKAEQIRAAASITPLNRLLIETDSPYLAPEPFRGRLNVPLYVEKVAEKIADLQNIPLSLLHERIQNNFLFFKERRYLNH